MPQPVFISYARDTSREHAHKLHEALGGRTAFLDTDAIEFGDRIPEAVVDALFDARVVVIFAEPRYFTRWYCLLEFRMARTPFLRVMERPGATVQEKEDALRGLVVALPPRGTDPMLERFPPLVQGRNWPVVDDIEGIARLVDAALAAKPPTLRERYASAAEADAARGFLLNEAVRLPPPRRIGNIPHVRPSGLPLSIRDEFVGRADDLWRIHDLLWTERGDPYTAAALTGAIEATGGFGKTRLALEYLYRFGPRDFRGGLFWIDAERDPELQLYEVLRALNPSTSPIEIVRQGSDGVAGTLARTIRARPDDAPTPLFIIDNVPEPEKDQFPKPLSTWCPVLGEVPVLTTSRTQIGLGTGGVVALPIETLAPEPATELLTTKTRRDALTGAEWKEIAAWVGHLPLALEVLNRLIRSGEMTAADVLERSRDTSPSKAIDDAMESIRGVVEPGALRGVTEAFSASYNLLTPDEQYAARLIAWMAPAPVPTFVIDAFGRNVFAPGVRSKLRNRSFVTEVREDSVSFFGAMHRLLGSFIHGQSEVPEQELTSIASLLISLMDSAEGQGSRGSALVRDCGPLTLSVFGNLIAGTSSRSGFQRMYHFANRAGIILLRWGHPALAGELFASLASASETTLGSEHQKTLSAKDNLAITRNLRGDHAGAQELQERVLEGMRRILGHEHQNTLASMNNLAGTLRAGGDYTGAQELLERVFAESRRINGEEHSDTLSSMSNLAVIRRDGGDHVGAAKLLERVVELRRRIYGEEHPDTLSAMSNLAVTRRRLGDNVSANELQEHVLEATCRLLGEDHPATLTAMNNIANARRDRDDHAGAEELQGRVVEARRRLLGEEHPETLTAIHNLAITLRVRGKLLEAQELQERVQETIRKRLGSEHPLTAVAGWGLLQIYMAKEDWTSADQLFQNDLRWLLDRDPVHLTGQQREIQARIREFESQINRTIDKE